MNRKKGKTALILLVAVLCAIVLLGIRGTRKNIDKTVSRKGLRGQPHDLHALLHHHFRHAQKDVVFHQLRGDLCHGKLRALVQRRRRS